MMLNKNLDVNVDFTSLACYTVRRCNFSIYISLFYTFHGKNARESTEIPILKRKMLTSRRYKTLT